MSRRMFLSICFLSFLTVVGTSAVVKADLVIGWTFNDVNTFNGGQTLTGYVNYDCSTNMPISWDFTVSPGTAWPQTGTPIPGFEFTSSNSYWTYVGTGNGFVDSPDPYHIPWTYMLMGVNYDQSSGGTITLPAGQSHLNYYYNTPNGVLGASLSADGTMTGVPGPVPAPATLLLLGPGLAGLAVLRRRVKK